MRNDTSSSDNSHDLILDATERLLGRFGYSKMTMEEIAREAGLSRRTVYLHFPSKEEVALASIDRIVERLLAQMEAVAARGSSTIERLREMLLLRVLFRFDSVRDYYQGLDELLSAIRASYMSRRQRYFEAEARVLARVIEEGQLAGSIRSVDPLAAAHSMLLATAALMPYSLSVRELGSRGELERRAGAIVDLLLYGVRAAAVPCHEKVVPAPV